MVWLFSFTVFKKLRNPRRFTNKKSTNNKSNDGERNEPAGKTAKNPSVKKVTTS